MGYALATTQVTHVLLVTTCCKVVIFYVCKKRFYLNRTFLKKRLNYFTDNFHGAVESTTDLSMGIGRGRIAGGGAIICHKELDTMVCVIRLEADRCIAVQIRMNNKEFIILNVHTPMSHKVGVKMNT